MKLRILTLYQFRNYADEKISMHPGINAFTGLNGMGKTNILDAVYYLCLGKSFFNASDKHIYMNEKDAFRISGTFEQEGYDETVTIKSIAGQKKEISISGKKLTRIADHVGRFPCVMIAPADIQILLSGSEERRNFMNNTIVQYDAEYLDQLLTYNRLLKQRNALLKQIQDTNIPQPELLNVISEKMAAPADYIFKARQHFESLLQPVFTYIYELVSGRKESCSIQYESQLSTEDFMQLNQKNRPKDLVLARTTGGIHKDDLNFLMNGRELKEYGSQGQLKSFVLALKLSQYKILHQVRNIKPILLLDDIFDKLDKQRVSNLLSIVRGEDFGQVLLTDTQEDRIHEILSNLGQEYRIFTVDNGHSKLSKLS